MEKKHKTISNGENSKGERYRVGEKGEEEEERCGIACCKPSFLQFFSSIRWYVFWACVFSFIEGFIVNGVVNIIIVALETRYELPSSKSGMIASANDFGALPFLIIIGYIGEKTHKPKFMGTGILVMALGCLVFALPQFVGSRYRYTVSAGSTGNSSENICSLFENNTSSSCAVAPEDASSYDGYYALLIIGQSLLGIGAVPMFTLGLTYIDENSKTRDSALLIGFTFCAAAVGVAVGYIAGGQSLTVFVDIDKVDPNSVPLTPVDPQWVGAWWIGILAGFFAFILVTFPILAYPKRLPNFKQLQKEKKSETHVSAKDKMPQTASFGENIKEFPRALFHLFKNPAYTLIVLGGTVEIFIVGGLATFGAKLFQEFHDVDLVEAGFIMGIITIPGSGGGMILGGYLIKRFNMRVRGIIRLSCACLFICMLFAPAFLASCAGNTTAGVSVAYRNQTGTSLVSDCNTDCGCTTSGYEPICDKDGVAYFSPCHAGCTNIDYVNGTKIYQNCQCLSRSSSGTSGSISGTCPKAERCAWFYVFSVFIFLMMLFTFTTTSPVLQAMFRSVPHNQRSFGLGIQLVFGRLLGTTPGPIFLGAIIDSSCEVWQESCGVRGNCWIYRKWDLGIKVMLWWMGTKLVGVILLFIAAKVYKPPLDTDTELSIEPETEKEKEAHDNPAFTIESKSQNLSNTEDNGYFTRL